MFISDWIILGAVCLTSSRLAVRWLVPRRLPRDSSFGLSSPGSISDTVFLFDSDRLISHSDIALVGYETVNTWDDLRALLLRDFPAFPISPDEVYSKGIVAVSAIDRTLQREVRCEWLDGIVRVQLSDKSDGDTAEKSGQAEHMAFDMAPYPVWLLDSSDRVRWCNTAYSNLARKLNGKDADLTVPLLPNVEADVPTGKKTRIAVSADSADTKLWFDLTTVQQDDGLMCYAVDINAIVEAEVAQRKFIQTMAKTFAQLSIGLAIFDRNRQLALFNPALVDLTALPAVFLSCRPSLSSFFDRLRDQHMMPEPKNYRSWRKQMNELLEAAEGGTYQETWSLSSGSVYSVSGRPHPDGAIAFLFEDITAEITLTRRFRSEMDLMHAVFDKLADAIAVFSDDGTLAFTNYAYQVLWGGANDEGFKPRSIIDETRIWQKRCSATPIWGEVRDFVEMRKDRAEWSADIRLLNGVAMACAVTPIQNGATLVRFSSDTGLIASAGLKQASA